MIQLLLDCLVSLLVCLPVEPILICEKDVVTPKGQLEASTNVLATWVGVLGEVAQVFGQVSQVTSYGTEMSLPHRALPELQIHEQNICHFTTPSVGVVCYISVHNWSRILNGGRDRK